MIPKIQKILYATDLSEGASHAFGYAVRLALSNGAKISITNVYEKLSSQTNIQMRSEDLQSAKQKLEDRIRARLARYCESEKEGEGSFEELIDSIYIAYGDPVEQILGQAKKGGYDLIVMGTHGHGFLFSAFIGSTAQRMIQKSDIPVMVVRLPVHGAAKVEGEGGKKSSL